MLIPIKSVHENVVFQRNKIFKKKIKKNSL